MIEAQAIAAPSRRGFLAGALALVAAPAIIKVSSLMPVNARLVPGGRQLLTLNEITQGSVRLFQTSNPMLRELTQYEPLFSEPPAELDILYGVKDLGPAGTLIRERFQASVNALADQVAEDIITARDFYEGEQWGDTQVGTMLRIRLPHDWDALPVHKSHVAAIQAPPLDKLALAVAAPVVLAKALEQPVTRRFWGKRE